ncbi:TniB family NTP-binding protein [Tranquillimonas alkanivorans]|uniref:AAA domain-containing protein n=1 Tax=Tranquillimonas alkanivorans TaxID=441119 RepID=A0A1I5WUU7_9RHOB|nr:TniB family NTP-binding protein [Tranquillimonas alkanivorans]SFQ23523.1 AAA domain-containing protein [Tranquillimonas alkanivorans]
MMDRPDAARLTQKLRSMHVPNERDAEVAKQILRLLERDAEGRPRPVACRFTAERETRGIAMIEPAGGGKTTAVRRVLQSIPALSENPETGLPRYLELQVPSPATLKSVGLTILSALGLPAKSPNAREWEIWEAVRHRLALLGIVVLWLDEAQDLLMAKSISDTENSLRMIKSLMQGPHAVIPILSGTQRLASMTALDPQVSRRFSKIVPADLQHGTDDENLLGMIDAYCDKAGVEAVLSPDLPARLITASRRRFGRAVEIVVNAIECALWDEAKVLTTDHFAEAWAVQEGCETDQNVFSAQDFLSIELDKGAEQYEEARMMRLHKKLGKA